MKLARRTFPFIAAMILLAVCLLAVGLSPLILPDYKDTIEQLDPPKGSNLLYINSGEELELYPWNLYTGQEKVYLNSDVYAAIANGICLMRPGLWSQEEVESKIILKCSNTGMRFLKDMELPGKDGQTYLVSMAYDPRGLCYFSCINQDEPEVKSEIMDQALRELQEDWEDFLADPAIIERGVYESSPIEIEGDSTDSESTESGNAFSSFFYSYQMFLSRDPEYLSDQSYVILDLIMKTQFTSLSYDNHIYLTCSDNSGTSLVLIYSPIEECFVGFSLKY